MSSLCAGLMEMCVHKLLALASCTNSVVWMGWRGWAGVESRRTSFTAAAALSCSAWHRRCVGTCSVAMCGVACGTGCCVVRGPIPSQALTIAPYNRFADPTPHLSPGNSNGDRDGQAPDGRCSDHISGRAVVLSCVLKRRARRPPLPRSTQTRAARRAAEPERCAAAA